MTKTTTCIQLTDWLFLVCFCMCVCGVADVVAFFGLSTRRCWRGKQFPFSWCVDLLMSVFWCCCSCYMTQNVIILEEGKKMDLCMATWRIWLTDVCLSSSFFPLFHVFFSTTSTSTAAYCDVRSFHLHCMKPSSHVVDESVFYFLFVL